MLKTYRNRIYRAVLRRIPHGPKYALVTAWQRTFPPYPLVEPGHVVVQIGIAGPLCELGRSQAIIYGRLVGPAGKVYAFEAIPENVEQFHGYIRKHGIGNIEAQAIGLWKERALLTFNAPPPGRPTLGSRLHLEGSDQTRRFETQRELPVDSLDNLLAGKDLARLDVINITTNGAEPEIVMGAMTLVKRFRPVICLPARAETTAFFDEMLVPMGYRKHHDAVRLHAWGKPFEILWGAPADRPSS
jgi:FkbM family methyltransferase